MILPYKYPTTVLIVDDNADFLASAGLVLNENIAYRLFLSPHEALRYIKQSQFQPALGDRCIHEYEENPDTTDQQVVSLDFGALKRAILNPRRFEEISLIVTNYDMPGLNGVNFLKQVKLDFVQKMLLTGTADEDTIVDAFNGWHIQRYQKKSTNNVFPDVNSDILMLQSKYLSLSSDLVQKALDFKKLSFAADPSFDAFFNQLCEKHNFVEHYYCASPGGYLLATPAGQTSFLLVHTLADRHANLEIAGAFGVSGSILQGIATGELVADFGQGAVRERAVAESIYNATMFHGQEDYSYTLIDHYAVEGEILGYRQYLDQLDDTWNTPVLEE